MNRIVPAGVVVQSQLDYYSPPGSITRLPGVGISALTAVLFASNTWLGWPLVDGTLIPDGSISAGSIYFNEIAGSPSYYSVRFFPDRIGFWRLIVTNIGANLETILEYDAVAVPPGPSGLTATFIR